MAEVIKAPVSSDTGSILVAPKIIRNGAKKIHRSNSDLWKLISYNPEKNCKIRIPAYNWDSTEIYGENTPLRYFDGSLRNKLKDLDITISDPYLDYGFKKHNLIGLEYAVTPVNKIVQVEELCDFFMNDKDEGMNCGYGPHLKYTVYLRNRIFENENESRELNLGSVYGFLSWNDKNSHTSLHYKFNNNEVMIKKNSTELKLSRIIGKDNEYININATEFINILSFNKTENGYELIFQSMYPDKKENVIKTFFTNKGTLFEAIEEISKNPTTIADLELDRILDKNLISYFDDAVCDALGNVSSSDKLIYGTEVPELNQSAKKVSKKRTSKKPKKADSEETATIGDIVSAKTDNISVALENEDEVETVD